MELNYERGPAKSVKLPLKSNSETPPQQLAIFKSLFDEHRNLTKGLLNSVHFFLESVTSRYAGHLLINEKDQKFYEGYFELFNFNHFNVKFELDDYFHKESEITKQIEQILSLTSSRTDQNVLRQTNLSIKVDYEKQIKTYQNKIQSQKRKLGLKKDSIKKLHEKYLDALKQIDDLNEKISLGMDLQRKDRRLIGSNAHPHSLVLNNSSDNELNKTFDIFLPGKNVSVNAFNPHDLGQSRSFTSISGNYQRNSACSNSKAPSLISLDAENVKNKVRKRDIERYQKEIEMLNKELNLLKREIKEEKQEKAIVIGNYEKSVKYERESSFQMIKNLKNKLESNQSGDVRVENHFETPGSRKSVISPNRFNGEDSGISQAEVTSMLSSKIVQKNQTVFLLKNSLNGMLTEKRQLQSNLNQKTNEISELQNKISLLENTSNKITKNMSELEMANSNLTTKFLMSVEREAEVMKKYNQMKMKLNTYEKLIDKLKIQVNK